MFGRAAEILFAYKLCPPFHDLFQNQGNPDSLRILVNRFRVAGVVRDCFYPPYVLEGPHSKFEK